MTVRVLILPTLDGGESQQEQFGQEFCKEMWSVVFAAAMQGYTMIAR